MSTRQIEKVFFWLMVTTIGTSLLVSSLFGQSVDKPSNPFIVKKEPTSTFNSLKSIQSETDEKSSIISVFFGKSPSWEKPEIQYDKNFFQIKLDNITILEPGKSYPSQSNHFKKIIPFQIDPNTSALRVYLDGNSLKYKQALSSDILGERLLIYLDHNLVTKSEKPSQIKSIAAPKPEKLDKDLKNILENTKVKSNIPDPITITNPSKKAKNTTSKKTGYFDKLNSKFQLVAVVSGVMILLLLFMGLIKRRVLKSRANSKKDNSPKIPDLKPIATYSIGPKQRLTLIEIQNKMILLGVSSDNIQYLYSSPDPEPTLESSITPKNTAPREIREEKRIPPRETILEGKNSRQYNREPKIRQTSEFNQGNYLSSEVDKRPHETKLSKKAPIKPSKAIEDVTSLIRKKLKDLPSI